MKKIIYLLAFIATTMMNAQDFSSIISSYLNTNKSQLGLQEQDVADISISSHSYSKSMQVENVYATQQYQGIEIYNTSSSFAIRNGAVLNANTVFVENIASKVNTTTPSLTPVAAINKAAMALGLNSPTGLNIIEVVSNHETLYSNGNISLENIPVKLVYQPTQDGLRLAWDLSIYLTDRSHWYSVRIDALNGNLLDTQDWVVSCTFGDAPHSGHNNAESILMGGYTEKTSMNMGTASYRVFPHPFESPLDGASQLVSDPADLVSSPFGWHDTDGTPGAEFTRTKGNNVDAHDDIDGNNSIEEGPDGGPTLTFDFPYGLPQTPIDYLDAATTNLFYWNNIVHDVTYRYGFDEASGNFQSNNYGNGGVQGDFVFAQSQDGAGLNNANFGAPPDGGNGVMQMFLWNAPGKVLGTLMTVNGGPFDGPYLAYDSNYGGTQLSTTTPITADLALVEDDDASASTDPNDGCDTITNPGDLSGKIAVVRRGQCNFTVKVAAAEAAGAVAVVVVNNVPTDPIPMGGTGAGIGIPAIMIYQADGEPIITALDNGDTVNATLFDDGSGDDPFQRDGDLDNEIIVHEYGHGVSIRLTGGPGNSGCLGNEDQAGEGWSDYLGLVLTMEAGDTGEDLRGFGTYAIGQGQGGVGIRSFPYSTDLAISGAITYTDTRTLPVPHGVGSVWTQMLWDLTWNLIDEYGFDPDVYNGTGGNNIALQLVLDGMKLQGCFPGFVDARDAILEADELANGGANRCTIWESFAARGLGTNASQGSRDDNSDNVEGFDLPTGPDCTLGVDDQGNYDNNFIIYPNPSNGNINIKSVINVGDVTISIFDMNGRKVFTEDTSLESSVNINANGLVDGIYVLQISGNNYTHSAKIIIR